MRLRLRATVPKLRVIITSDMNRGLASCRIEDNGCGIPKDKLGDIFEPYYTTKPPGRGTGLGLFVVKQILESSQGHLSVASDVGSGTAFMFDMPLTRDVSLACPELGPVAACCATAFGLAVAHEGTSRWLNDHGHQT